ncbi:hypothetical protein [Kutzneria albida]|uniref:Uncharacterized protein n=1 Tax=Kutzneria albida DSM 43870 TaxID=1449976 RepID=W5W0U7_9PSEU|nr:hypothetical protein [Kutzneria albida]AHH94467.1 hypothetical protein KALB_1094 [Kutzneria albida DSM 43870]
MSSMYILDAPGYPTTGAIAMSGVSRSGEVGARGLQQQSAQWIDRALTNAKSAATKAVKVRTHLLSSASERGT